MGWQSDDEMGVSWKVGKESNPRGLLSNISPIRKSEKYVPYRYKRMENGDLDERLREANEYFTNKDPEQIVRSLIKKFGER